jgi:alginate O-acetyltransferase complex protein AlgI
LNFASFQFVGFFLVLLSLYWLAPGRQFKNLILISGSYYFYSCWDVRFLALIVVCTAFSYFCAGQIQRHQADQVIKKRWLVAYLVFSLGLLGVFKYFNFFVGSMAALLQAAGLNVRDVHLNIILPAAISFYTFESISYVMGAFKGELKRKASYLDYSLFIAFFPKLVAGPIERPNVLIPQLQDKATLSWSLVRQGAFLILLGMFKKITIADGLAPTVSGIFDSGAQPSAADVVLATLAFSLQIYGDFSGYSDIARGVAMFFGIELSANFKFPYFSKDPSEFWRRWHISLSTWLRDYLYIPMGGNRGSERSTYRNLFLTMLIGGLWHGAAWTFVAWGAYQGLLLCVHRALKPALSRLRQAFSLVHEGVYEYVALAVFFALTCYGWLLFRAGSFEQVWMFTQQLLLAGGGGTVAKAPPLSTLLGLPVLLLFDRLAYRSESQQPQQKWGTVRRAGLYAALLVLIIMGMANSRSSFIYFQF